MKISLKWLNEYIEIADYFDKPEALSEILTRAGLEVESIENKGKDFQNVVIGHILKREAHPNADRLTFCQVSTGGGRVHAIVCGAKNHKEDDRVVVALPGAVLPGNFAIKRSAIRGIESEGMLCSEKELGLKGDTEGIIILPTDAPIGEAYGAYMGFDDVTLELKVTPNRADCLSHFGLARELSSLLGRPCELKFKPFTHVKDSTKAKVPLEVKRSDACPRYAGRVIRGVKIAPSPRWLSRHLESVGVNSINNVVDVTNFVMLELGQPLHAFDLAHLAGPLIQVDFARSGEVFKSFDGTEIKLDGTELMIRDADKPVALAGVVGGVNSGVGDATKDLFIESAYFRASQVRRTARKHGIETDSSYRFSRGVDPDAILLALNRSCELIQQVAGGDIFGDHHDFYPQPLMRPKISASIQYISERMGSPVLETDFISIMKRLGCNVQGDAGVFQVEPPLYRGDLIEDVDLVEEYARIQGYEKIAETVPAQNYAPTSHDADFLNGNRLSLLFRAQGFQEALNYGFINHDFQAKILGDVSRMKMCGLETASNPVGIKNPLNEEYNVMRTSLVPGLLKNISHNVRYGNHFGRIFERGYVFEARDNAYREDWRIAFAAWGNPEHLWTKGESVPVVLDLKARIENVLKNMSVRGWRWDKAATAPDFCHPGQTAVLVCEGKTLGFIGTLHPALREADKIRETVAIGEFDLDQWLTGHPRVNKTKSIGRFPAVERDIAFVVPRDLSAGAMISEMEKTGGDLLKTVLLFDVFQGGSLPENMKSMAFRLVYEDLKETLTDDRIQTTQNKILDSVTKKFNIQLRS